MYACEHYLNNRVYKVSGIIWLLFLIGPLYLTGVWLSEDQRTNATKAHVSKRLAYSFFFY